MDKKAQEKKKAAKAYEKYADKFTPKPKYFSNSIRAFVSGGTICTIALIINNGFLAKGMEKETAGGFVTVILICAAQFLTGIGIFDTIAKFAGAGVIVPITGFANSMVAPAIEYKKEGLVLGVGAKLFSLAGPVLVYGISTATVIGIIYWIIGNFS